MSWAGPLHKPAPNKSPRIPCWWEDLRPQSRRKDLWDEKENMPQPYDKSDLRPARPRGLALRRNRSSGKAPWPRPDVAPASTSRDLVSRTRKPSPTRLGHLAPPPFAPDEPPLPSNCETEVGSASDSKCGLH